MLRPYSSALGASRILLGILRAFNLLTGVMLVAAIPASFLFEPQFFEFFSKRPPRIDQTWLVPVLRMWFVLALLMVAAVHVLLSRLLAVVETVRAGDPFVAENAVRLKTIAWCVLATQLLHLTFDVGGNRERCRLERRLEILGVHRMAGCGSAVRAGPGLRRGHADARRPGKDDLTWPSS
jgi:hypothetical protein